MIDKIVNHREDLFAVLNATKYRNNINDVEFDKEFNQLVVYLNELNVKFADEKGKWHKSISRVDFFLDSLLSLRNIVTDIYKRYKLTQSSSNRFTAVFFYVYYKHCIVGYYWNELNKKEVPAIHYEIKLNQHLNDFYYALYNMNYANVGVPFAELEKTMRKS